MKMYESKHLKCARCGKAITPETWSAPVSGSGEGVWCLPCYTYNTGMDRQGNPVVPDVSKTILQDALRRKEQEEQQQERQLKNQHAEVIIQNIDTLLLLVDKHDRTSCSDTNNFNYDKGRCTRCALIQAEADGFWRNDLNLRITVEYDEKHATVV